ncbi:hypothetical protein E0D81_21290 [Lelliottia amnigena]|uniref:hypothetical protein n=1 Tax=Lelliottia amnigena TaxID=61646 RepID=UPI00103B0A4E|nr:hypothetical protein [Lelliottia amnigena]TCD13286.1 hypothetical protein E0D81_21290 [Lelliottia amnigena]
MAAAILEDIQDLVTRLEKVDISSKESGDAFVTRLEEARRLLQVANRELSNTNGEIYNKLTAILDDTHEARKEIRSLLNEQSRLSRRYLLASTFILVVSGLLLLSIFVMLHWG